MSPGQSDTLLIGSDENLGDLSSLQRTAPYHTFVCMIILATCKDRKLPVLVDWNWWRPLRTYKWYVTKAGYVAREFTAVEAALLRLPRRHVYIHQIVTGFKARRSTGLEVDHRDGNRRDNRLQNLRVVPMAVNNRNKHKIDERNTSGATGVYWSKAHRRWEARVFIGAKAYCRSSRSWTVEDAAKAREALWREIHGEKGASHHGH